MTYLFQNATAFNPHTGEGVPNATGQVFALSDVDFTTPLAVTLLSSGLQSTELVSDQYSQIPGFDAGDKLQVVFKSGEFTKILNTSTPIPGPVGPSAYVVAVENGYTGTEAEYNAALAEAPALVTRAESAEQAAIAAAGLVDAPAGDAVLAAISEGGAARNELSATIDGSLGVGGAARPTLDAAILAEGAEHFVGNKDGVIIGTGGKKYAFVGCVIRHVDNTVYWQPINDAGHVPVNVASVTTNSSQININYSVTGAKVITSSVVTDETLAINGYFCGASVGLSFLSILMSQTIALSDYISWNGTAWVSSAGKMIPGTMAANGTLTLTHQSIAGLSMAATIRESPLQVSIGGGGVGPGATTLPLQFRGPDGVVLTTPTTDMKVFVTRNGQATINPQLAPPAGHNLWVYVLLELP